MNIFLAKHFERNINIKCIDLKIVYDTTINISINIVIIVYSYLTTIKQFQFNSQNTKYALAVRGTRLEQTEWDV